MRFDPLPEDVAEVLARTGDDLSARVRYLREVGSTNDVAATLARAGEPAGSAVLAAAQTAGRGRRGRQWWSAAGAGVYLSVIVTRPAGPRVVPLVTLAAGVAAARAIETATGLSPELKWPNDVVTGRPWRKLGGILCEAAAGAPGGPLIVGYGINLRAAALPGGLPDHATTLEAELGRPVDRGALVVAILHETTRLAEQLGAGDTAAVVAAWRSFGEAGLRGRAVHWDDADEIVRGRTLGVDDLGRLLVETADGRRRVLAGEVVWENSPGE